MPDIFFSDNDSDDELMSKVRFIISNPAIFIRALRLVLYLYKKRLDSLETELEDIRNKLEGKKDNPRSRVRRGNYYIFF